MMQLLARGKQRNKVVVAVARELSGFVWHIFRIMEPRVTPQEPGMTQQEPRVMPPKARIAQKEPGKKRPTASLGRKAKKTG